MMPNGFIHLARAYVDHNLEVSFMPPSTLSDEEIDEMIKFMDQLREKIRGNPKEAKRFLQEAGIHTRTGKLTKPYRSK